MTKKTLLEKMRAQDNVPQSWISEVGSMLRTIEREKERAQEYGLIIDDLAPKIETMREYVAHKSGSCYLGVNYKVGPKDCVCGLDALLDGYDKGSYAKRTDNS